MHFRVFKMVVKLFVAALALPVAECGRTTRSTRSSTSKPTRANEIEIQGLRNNVNRLPKTNTPTLSAPSSDLARVPPSKFDDERVPSFRQARRRSRRQQGKAVSPLLACVGADLRTQREKERDEAIQRGKERDERSLAAAPPAAKRPKGGPSKSSEKQGPRYANGVVSSSVVDVEEIDGSQVTHFLTAKRKHNAGEGAGAGAELSPRQVYAFSAASSSAAHLPESLGGEQAASSSGAASFTAGSYKSRRGPVEQADGRGSSAKRVRVDTNSGGDEAEEMPGAARNTLPEWVQAQMEDLQQLLPPSDANTISPEMRQEMPDAARNSLPEFVQTQVDQLHQHLAQSDPGADLQKMFQELEHEIDERRNLETAVQMMGAARKPKDAKEYQAQLENLQQQLAKSDPGGLQKKFGELEQVLQKQQALAESAELQMVNQQRQQLQSEQIHLQQQQQERHQMEKALQQSQGQVANLQRLMAAGDGEEAVLDVPVLFTRHQQQQLQMQQQQLAKVLNKSQSGSARDADGDDAEIVDVSNSVESNLDWQEDYRESFEKTTARIYRNTFMERVVSASRNPAPSALEHSVRAYDGDYKRHDQPLVTLGNVKLQNDVPIMYGTESVVLPVNIAGGGTFYVKLYNVLATVPYRYDAVNGLAPLNLNHPSLLEQQGRYTTDDIKRMLSEAFERDYTLLSSEPAWVPLTNQERGIISAVINAQLRTVHEKSKSILIISKFRSFSFFS